MKNPYLAVDNPKNPEFDRPQKYGIDGVINFHIKTRDLDENASVDIGAWLIIPKDELDTTLVTAHGIESASQIIGNTKKSVLLYLHGVACNRALPVPIYEVLRQFFLIVAVDHRGMLQNCGYNLS